MNRNLRWTNKSQGQSGFSMIEVLVTVAITSIGLVGLAFSLLHSDRMAQENGYKTAADGMIGDLIQRIRFNADAYSDYNTNGNYSCGSTPAHCAAWNNGSSRQEADSCSATELAAWDLWDIACNSNISSDADFTYSGNSDLLPNPTLNVSIEDGIGYNGSSSQITITVGWDARTSGTNSDGERSYIASDMLTDSVSTEFSLWHD